MESRHSALLHRMVVAIAACYLLSAGSAAAVVAAGQSARAAAPATTPAPVAPVASTAQPNVHVLPTPFVIPGLNRQRTVRIYLPPGYGRAQRRYPVLYMHDGQNLFDDATAYAGEWGVDETLNAFATSPGTIPSTARRRGASTWRSLSRC